MKSLVWLTAVLLLILSGACDSPPPGRGAGEIEQSASSDVEFRVETVVSGLQVPWSIVWTSDGRMLFTERPGRVRAVVNGQLLQAPVFTVPDVEPSSESGLMGMALHPKFSDNQFVYLAYSFRSGTQQVRVVRYRDDGRTLTDRKVIVDNIPAAPNHAGCRLGFGPDGKLYITTGDATERQLAQRLDSLAGKTLRVNDDGTVPADNPFVSQQNARPEIWSLGHRNAQGMDWQPGSNLMFQTEHGPSGFDGPGGGDEVNIVERGKNYGWPTIHHNQTQSGLVSPLLEYTPACAPASGMFYKANSFPQFRENFFFGCLRGERIIRVILNGRNVTRQENMLEKKYGRIREVAQGPGGAIYFSTSNRDGRGSPATDDDRIIRLVPLKSAQ